MNGPNEWDRLRWDTCDRMLGRGDGRIYIDDEGDIVLDVTDLSWLPLADMEALIEAHKNDK